MNNIHNLMLVNASLPRVAEATGTLMTLLDTVEPGARAASICAAFLTVCQRLELDPRDVFRATRKMIDKAPEYGVTEFDALRLYLTEEDIK